ncbi:hypothetical protein RB195_015928 [Necator americanus]|uniref:Uncharacterized protein n=1 Tax=Necator americanus TaxID=51031 RepID=A0ABR1E788_NECAM
MDDEVERGVTGNWLMMMMMMIGAENQINLRSTDRTNRSQRPGHQDVVDDAETPTTRRLRDRYARHRIDGLLCAGGRNKPTNVDRWGPTPARNAIVWAQLQVRD